MTGRPRKQRSAPLPVPEIARPAKVEREPGESDEEFYLRALPKPPIGTVDDATAAAWMEDCYSLYGMAAVAWLWEPINWPLGPPMRARMFHMFGQLHRRDQMAAERRAAEAEEERRQRARQEAHERRKQAGWA